MAELNLNGKHYEGNKIQVKKDGVYVDGKFQSKIPPPNQSRDSQIDEVLEDLVEHTKQVLSLARTPGIKWGNDDTIIPVPPKAKAALQKIIDSEVRAAQAGVWKFVSEEKYVVDPAEADAEFLRGIEEGHKSVRHFAKQRLKALKANRSSE